MYSGLNNILNSVSPNITDALFTKYVNQVEDAGPLHQIWIRPVTVLVCASLTVIQLAEVVSRVAFAAILLIPFLVSFAFSDENATQFREKFEEQFSPGNLTGQILAIALLPTAIAIGLIFTGIYSEPKPSNSDSESSDGTPPPPEGSPSPSNADKSSRRSSLPPSDSTVLQSQVQGRPPQVDTQLEQPLETFESPDRGASSGSRPQTPTHASTEGRVASWMPLRQPQQDTVRHDGSPVRSFQLESGATPPPPPAEEGQLSLSDTATLRDVSRESSGPQAPQVLADLSSSTGPQRKEVTPVPAENILATAAAPAPASV